MASQELEQVLAELKNFETKATFPRIKNVLNAEIKKVESEIAQKLKVCSQIPAEKSQKSIVRRVIELNEHAFDESDKFVKIYIPFNKAKITDENVEVDFTGDSFNLTIHTDQNDYRFKVTSLLKPINVEKSYKKVKSQDEMVALYLKKEKEGVKWECLTKTEKHLKDSKSKAFEDKEDTKDDPMGGLMNIMKKMYDSGDSEMKRTIAKAWTEGQEKSRGAPMM